MSLELALEKHTAAVETNTAVLEKLLGVLTETVPQPITVNIGEMTEQPPPAESTKTTRTKPKKEAALATTGEPEARSTAPATPAAFTEESAQSHGTTAGAAQTTEAAATAIEPPTYGEVAPWVTRVAKEKGKPAVLELLGKFKAGHFSQVAESDYAAVLAAAKDILGEAF